MDLAFKLTSGTNKFGLYVTFLAVIHGFLSFLSYSVPFLTKMPTMKCSWGDICEIDFTDDNTIVNWITHMKLVNETKFHLGFIGSSFFIGYLVGSITILWLPDIYGRWIMVLVSMFAIAICSILLYAASTLTMLYIILSITGFF